MIEKIKFAVESDYLFCIYYRACPTFQRVGFVLLLVNVSVVVGGVTLG